MSSRWELSRKMYCIAVIVLLVLPSIKCNDAPQQSKDHLEIAKMLGINAIHEVKQENKLKIDQNTIITKNLKLSQKARNLNQNASRSAEALQQTEPEPDWSYESFPPEVAAHAAQFKLNMSQCLKEVQANEGHKRLSPGKNSPVHGDCLIACVLKRNGVIESGKVNKGNLLRLVSKFFGKNTKMMKKLEKNLDRCVEMSAGRDDCDLAARLNECTNDLMAGNKRTLNIKY